VIWNKIYEFNQPYGSEPDEQEGHKKVFLLCELDRTRAFLGKNYARMKTKEYRKDRN
jgi:hypothetical protein